MKPILKNILKYYLKYITKLVLFIHKPVIIAVAGSSNKTIVKDEIASRLAGLGYDVRSNPKSFNTEIGLPLAILYLESGYNYYRQWLPVISGAIKRLFVKKFPAILVLELGTSDPGDMKYLLRIVKPRLAILTDINQRYIESFSDMDELVREYKYLATKLPSEGLLILNNDNPRIKELAQTGRSKKATFGFSQGSDCQIETRPGRGEQTVTLSFQGRSKQFEIKRPGRHHASACAVGLIVTSYESLLGK